MSREEEMMSGGAPKRDHASWVRSLVEGFCDSPENSLRNETNEPAWDRPLVGFSRGDDPVFQEMKAHIGPFYWTPVELFRLAFPDVEAEERELAVISWVLPQTKATRLEHRKEARYPSERWARSRKFGEDFNMKLRQHLVSTLGQAGFQAVAPLMSPHWSAQMSDRYGYASTWSERHAAYASGLGTFGLCDGLITPAGKAMRCGSVVARIDIPPTPRPYSHHHAYCLFFSKGTCGKCIDRCPAGALSKEGHDKVKCREYVDATVDYVRTRFGFECYGCGLCQTRVPCESRIPKQ